MTNKEKGWLVALKSDTFWGETRRKIDTFHLYFEFVMDLRHTGRETGRGRERETSM